jgi:hypothetical protein
MGMSMWRLAWGALTLVVLNQAAFAGGRSNLHPNAEIGERFLDEYQKNYPDEKWELIGTTRMSQSGAIGRTTDSETIRVYFKRANENTLQAAACVKTREKDWVCEVGPNLPEGSLVVR